MLERMVEDCEVCVPIKCKNCGWEPNVAELKLVLAGKLTSCPDCGVKKSS